MGRCKLNYECKNYLRKMIGHCVVGAFFVAVGLALFSMSIHCGFVLDEYMVTAPEIMGSVAWLTFLSVALSIGVFALGIWFIGHAFIDDLEEDD